MKTTIDLPDELLHRAKIVAAQRKTTLKEIVILGMDHVIKNPESMHDEKNKRKTTIQHLIRQMKATNTSPMVPLTREEIYAER